jgi:hypothetical protein
VYLKTKKSRGRLKAVSSFEAVRQRELAWMLYITEGYLANLAHALAVNGVTFGPSDATAIQGIVEQVEKHSEKLRNLLQHIASDR